MQCGFETLHGVNFGNAIIPKIMDRVSISIVGVRIKSAFHLTNTQFGWVLSAFVLAYALFEIPSGIMGDRLGQRKVLLRIVIWWSVFTALTGCVFGLTSLIAVRFLFGVGEAGAYPNSCGVISRWVPKSETSRGMSWLGNGSADGCSPGAADRCAHRGSLWMARSVLRQCHPGPGLGFSLLVMVPERTTGNEKHFNRRKRTD